MSPGVGEEVGKTTRGLIDALASQPLSLALVFMNVCLLALFWFIFAKSNDHAQAREQQMFAEQKEVRDLLSRCIVPAMPKEEGSLAPKLIAWWWDKRPDQAPFALSSAGETTLLKPEQERRILELLGLAIDEALKDQVMHLFEVWMKSPGDETAASRAGVGARNAVQAYRGAMRALDKKRRVMGVTGEEDKR